MSNNYIHLASYSPEKILDLIPEKWITVTVDGKEYKIQMNSSRYHLFALSRICACCGLEGTIMMLDVCPNQENSAHFNLYGRYNGELVLFTKDHIIPKSKGGHNGQSNLQTMCVECNKRKSNYITTENMKRSQYIIQRKEVVEKEKDKNYGSGAR